MVLGAVVVFVNVMPLGVVTVHEKELATDGVTLVLNVTDGEPGKQPDTAALGFPIMGHTHICVTVADNV